MKPSTLSIVVGDSIRLHKPTFLSLVVYCPSGWSADRDNIAAWPAAVAASLDFFLSASGEIVNENEKAHHLVLTSFLLSLDVLNDRLNLREFQALETRQEAG